MFIFVLLKKVCVYIFVQELSSSRSNLLKVQSEVEKHRTDMDRKVMEMSHMAPRKVLVTCWESWYLEESS